jgi:mono/diheme cytochrome c family protein
VSLLKTGISARGSTLGPMAEVVFRSTQYLERDDLRAIAVFLQALPPAPAAPTPRAPAPKAGDALLRQGAAIYAEHCAECHGEHGEGVASIYPPIAGNRSVTLATPINLVNVILRGGFPPATAGNPRPFGMPPFAHSLTNEEIAAVATYVRQSWGHAASPVTPVEVFRLR